MTIPAPRINSNMPADAWLHVANITSADVDLTAQTSALTGGSSGGKFAAQRVRLTNATAAALTAVLIPEQKGDGTASQSFVVAAQSSDSPNVPIKKIVASGSGALSADVFWWYGNSIEVNK